MSVDFRKFVRDNLIEPLRYFNTTEQDVILEIIADKLQTVYDTAEEFPNIIDIQLAPERLLPIIAKSFAYDLDPKMPLDQQRNVLQHIVETYLRRGSYESIVNMRKYYGNHLPKDIQIIIPAYNLFRYSVSSFSGTDRLKDGKYWRSGVYEIVVGDQDYDSKAFKDFVLKEFAAAGASVLFSRKNVLDLGDFPDGFNVMHPWMNTGDYFISIELKITDYKRGFIYSTNTLSETRVYSGTKNLFFEKIYWFEDIASLVRVKEKSFFILEPKEIIRTIPNPKQRPINILSGLPVVELHELIEDPETFVGLESSIGLQRSYDYLYPVRQTIFEIYPARTSVKGSLSGRNALSGSPIINEQDRSWRERMFDPLYVTDIKERLLTDPIIIFCDEMTVISPENLVVETSIALEKVRMYDTVHNDQLVIERNLFDENGNEIVNDSPYPGYFVLGHSKLGDANL